MDGGLLFIDKGEGVTSRYVDNALQRLCHIRKVGHLGTLDPFATGLLIVAVGEATKYLPFLPDEEKTYVATLRLGVSTDSGDKTGTVIEEVGVPELQKEQIEAVLRGFLGKSTQIPPMTSAIKRDGTPLYELARKGISIEREPRPIEIYGIELLSIDGKEITFETTVSKGTYIRVLGEDIAKKLGTVGHLVSLRRTRVGNIGLDGATPLESIGDPVFLPPHEYVPYPRIELNGVWLKKARNGVKLPLDTDAPRVLVLGEGNPIAIYEREDGGLYRCLRGL